MTDEMKEKVKPGTIVEHYKRKRFDIEDGSNLYHYVVLAASAFNATTDELTDFVVYKALYGNEQVWIRSAEDFFADVEDEKTGEKFSRFTII